MGLLSKESDRWRHLAEQLAPDIVGLFEPGVQMEGKMKVSAGAVRLNSHFRGEIDSEGSVFVAEQGEVEAGIHAKIVSVSGKVKGAVFASERLEIKEHGVVLGDIHTPVLVVDPGGYLDGQSHMLSPHLAEQAAVDTSDAGAGSSV